MTPTLTASEVFSELGEKLELELLGETEISGELSMSADDVSVRPSLAGYLNLIHPNRIQVLGQEELTYWQAQSGEAQASMLRELLANEPLALVVSDGLDMPAAIMEAAISCSTALFRSNLPSNHIVNFLQYHLSRRLAERTTVHGVFMEVFTLGVHITGDAGCGKSELALELLNRGHRLIADDAPEFTQISPEIIDGTCPEALQDCLEVRGLGVLNVRRMFGDAAIKLHKFLRLIIHLHVPGEEGPQIEDRLRGEASVQRVLDLDIPRITFPVLAGRNLAVIVEAAVRDFMLKMKGFDAAEDFLGRHDRIMRRQARQWQD